MKEKKRYLAKLLSYMLFMLTFCMINTGCNNQSIIDETEFQLFYNDVTDIGPSMTMTLYAPTYIGEKPSDFSITGVKLDDGVVENNSFEIDPGTGAITIQNTGQLAIGNYTVSVACKSAGKNYNFADIIHINMMRSVPEGITAEPAKITIPYEEVVSLSPQNLPSAQISTDGNHIHINKYLIANIRHEGQQIANDDLFAISQKGLLTFGSNHMNIQPGKYVIDLKLTTAIVDEASEEGIFANAVEVNVTSKPLALTYEPNSSKVEQSTTDAVLSEIPVMRGSTEQLNYQIEKVTPAGAPVKIDPATGVLSLGENNLPLHSACKVSVKVTNQYGSTTFNDVYTFNIVPLIKPITKFAYASKVEFIEGVASSAKVESIDGDERKFEFKNLPAALEGKIDINPITGEITTAKGNTIPKGNYNVTVMVSNPKGSKETTFTLTVLKNKNMFTYVHWGNNLGLKPAKNFASQHRITSAQDLVIKITESDIQEGADVSYSIDENNSSGAATIDAKSGEITFKDWKNGKVFMILVQTTTGKGTTAEVSLKTPVFVHCSTPVNGVTINYTPFVFQVNPKTGGTSVEPEISGTDASTFLMDYRRTFNYYNINGPESHVTGQLKAGVTNTFIYQMWASYYGDAAVNAGARKPVSYYDNTTSLNEALCYVNANNKCAVTVNPNKWMHDGEYANGVFIGQMTFTTDGKSASVAKGSQVFPIAIWFSNDF